MAVKPKSTDDYVGGLKVGVYSSSSDGAPSPSLHDLASWTVLPTLPRWTETSTIALSVVEFDGMKPGPFSSSARTLPVKWDTVDGRSVGTRAAVPRIVDMRQLSTRSGRTFAVPATRCECLVFSRSNGCGMLVEVTAVAYLAQVASEVRNSTMHGLHAPG